MHGPVLDRLGQNSLSAGVTETLRSLLQDENCELKYQVRPLNSKALKQKIQAPLIGGNLTVICSSLATKFFPRVKNRILFFEDIGERGYKIERMLDQLKLSGSFDSVSGILFGEFSAGLEPSGGNRVQEAIEEFASSVSIPIWSGLPVGHGADQFPVLVGWPAVVGGDVFSQKLGPRKNT